MPVPDPDPITERDELYQGTHRLMAQLRAESPARPIRRFGGDGWGWLLTRYQDVKTAYTADVGRDSATAHRLLHEHSAPTVTQESGEAETAGPGDESNWEAHEILHLDPPDHTRLRKAVMKAFTPAAIDRMRPRIEQLTSVLIDEIAGPGPVDLMSAVAAPLPLLVICELLGVPVQDRQHFTRWAHVVNDDGIDEDARTSVDREMTEYLGEIADRKQSAPGDDLMSHLAQAATDGVLTREEVIAMAYLILIAGHDTTVGLIGNGMLELLRAPDQLALLRSDPALLPNAVEEMLRHACPVNILDTWFTREPVELGGTRIPAGDLLYVSILSANRDPRQFDNPDVFDITRKISGHLGFGHGIHYCIGAPLARLETQIVIGALLDRFPGLRLAVDPDTLEYRKSALMHALVTLPIYPK